jgi:hypothetical protein
MKRICLILSLLGCVLPLQADNWLENGDFSDGINHWHGDGRAPADFASDNPLAAADPLTSKGLIIVLKHFDWTKVAQDFKGKIAAGVLKVTYMVSPDLTFSSKPEDYQNMPDHIGYDRWLAFNTPPGSWVLFLSDFASSMGSYIPIAPTLGSATPQTFRDKVGGLTPLEDKTITLAFPPGQGKIILLNVSLTDQ